MTTIELGFDLALCVTSGEGFAAGKVYPVIGWNNGIGIIRADGRGDVFVFRAQNGGIGKGEWNNFNNSGSPSFREISKEVLM